MSGITEQILAQLKSALGKKKAASATEKADTLELIGKLKAMDSAYIQAKALPAVDPSLLPETTGQEPKIFVPKSQSELEDIARTELAPGYQKGIDKLEDARDSVVQKQQAAATSAESDYQKELAKLDEGVRVQSEAHKDNMIAQGLLHSSINATGQDAILDEFEARANAVKAAYDTKLAESSAKISLVLLDFETALSQYDLQHAASLETKIATLRLGQEKLKEEVNAYNKKLAEQELAYRQKRQKTLAAMEDDRQKRQRELDAQTLADEKSLGYTGDKATEMEARYKLAYDNYAAIDKETALSLINDNKDELKQTLGLYFQRLIDAIMAK